MSADPSTLDIAALTAEAARLGYVRDAAVWRGPDGRLRVWTHEAITPRWHEGLTRVLADEAAALRWLLDQPEARRLAAIVEAAEARGRDAERAAVVVATRWAATYEMAEAGRGDPGVAVYCALRRLADAFEAGVHTIPAAKGDDNA